MSTNQSKTHPTSYEIVVSGRVSPERAAWFGDMTMSERATCEGRHLTILSGAVADQAALFGALNRIRDLGLKLISVTPSEPSSNMSAQTLPNQEAS